MSYVNYFVVEMELGANTSPNLQHSNTIAFE